MRTRLVHRAAALAALGAPALCQAPPFQTPGMPSWGTGQPQGSTDSGQTTRFDSVFNPAFAFVVDAQLDYIDFDGPSADADGWDARLRSFELTGKSWVDPKAWAYFVAVADEETVAIEEAAVHYVGLPGNNTIRAGRFFVDFGKQMQLHVHDLRTIDRPLALRAYLGDEVKGDGAQWDCWTGIGDRTALRWSLGAFANLLPEESEFPSTDQTGAELEQEIEDRKGLGDFNFTARATAFTEVGTNGTLQIGTSWRGIPSFTFNDTTNGLAEDDLSNHVFGLDATYGWTSDTGLVRWTAGAEFLVDSGDTGATVIDPDATPATGDETLDVIDSTVNGYFAFADHQWNPFNSAGLQYSAVELPDAGESDVSEAELYYTRSFSEFHRLRFAITDVQSDAGDDSIRFAVQYTAFLGAHAHGLNW